MPEVQGHKENIAKKFDNVVYWQAETQKAPKKTSIFTHIDASNTELQADKALYSTLNTEPPINKDLCATLYKETMANKDIYSSSNAEAVANNPLSPNSNDENLRYTKSERFDVISNALHEDITSSNLGIPTTGKDFEKHIKLITPDNIMFVLENYKNNFGETLFEAIAGEWGLDDEVKERAIKHLNECLEAAKAKKPNANGKEDKRANNFVALKKYYAKNYPAPEYTVESPSEFCITIRDKNGVCVLECSIHESGAFDENRVNPETGEPKYCYCYDENMEFCSYYEIKCSDPISDALHEDITATNFGLPTTGKDFEKHIQQITPQNIINILDNYEDNYGESLLEAIESEWGLDDETKKRVLKHLNDCCAAALAVNGKVNCQIDKDFKQGKIGDCWFLSTIAAIKDRPKGQEILNNMITDNGDGTYTVKFKGTDKEYTVSALEIYSKQNYATGDLDVRILEIAAQKHYNILGIEHGGNPASSIELLLGTDELGTNMARNSQQNLAKKSSKNLQMTPILL